MQREVSQLNLNYTVHSMVCKCCRSLPATNKCTSEKDSNTVIYDSGEYNLTLFEIVAPN